MYANEFLSKEPYKLFLIVNKIMINTYISLLVAMAADEDVVCWAINV